MVQAVLYTIMDIQVRPYQRLNDQVVYPILVFYSTGDTFSNNYKYNDFTQLSISVHSKFSTLVTHLGYIKKDINIKPWVKPTNQKYIDRQIEIEAFCGTLLLLDTSIMASDTILSFFSEWHDNHTGSLRSPSPSLIKRTMSLKLNTKNHYLQYREMIKSSVRRISSPFESTANHSPMKSVSIITRSSASSRTNGSELFASSINSEESARGFFIRIKIVYDMQNIIILRVSRSTTFADLRSRVIHKFALVDIKLPEDVQFMISDSSSYSSGLEVDHSAVLSGHSVSVIRNETHYGMAKHAWNHLRKVTLQCLI